MRLIVFLLTTLLALVSYGQQSADSTTTKRLVDSINRLLDRSVVKKDTAVLQKYYADDFFFKHATGRIDSRASWIKSVQQSKNLYASREHDSIVVELHDKVAIVSGILSVRFPPQTRKAYALRYLRVFLLKDDRWQLISHHSTAEWKIENE